MARNRNVQIIFWVSEGKAHDRRKMTQAGMMSRAYRRIAIDGMIVRLELPELKEMVSLLRYASNNINQIARRMNESGRVYGTFGAGHPKSGAALGYGEWDTGKACRHQIMERGSNAVPLCGILASAPIKL